MKTQLNKNNIKENNTNNNKKVQNRLFIDIILKKEKIKREIIP